MDAGEHGLVDVGDLAKDHGDVRLRTAYLVLVGDHAEVTVLGGDDGLGNAADVAFVLEAVADELGDGEHFELMLVAEANKVRDTGHGAVVVHDLADNPGWDKAGHPGEVNRGFGLAGAHEDAALAGTQGHDMAGAGEVEGAGGGVNGDVDGVGTIRGGDAGGDAFTRFDGDGEGGSEARGVVLRHGVELEEVGPLFCESEADEATAEARHEVDRFGGDELRRDGEVALVFAVFIVDDDDHATSGEILKSVFNRCEHEAIPLL